MPALFTKTSSPPSSPASSETVSAAAAKSLTSSRRTAAVPPTPRTSFAVSRAPSSSVFQVTPTSKPARARATADALPIPESEPVMIALPAILAGIPALEPG